MIKPRALSEVLSSVCQKGIIAAIISSTEGALLGHAGGSENEAHIHSAILGSIWSAYEKQGHIGKSILVETEDNSIFTIKITPTLTLGLIANTSVSLGILRHTGIALKEFLEGPLQQL